MTSNTISYSLQAGIATLKLNRPEVYNSFNTEMAKAMQAHLKNCAENPEVRAVLIIGEGKGFSAGQDLTEAISPDSMPIAEIVANNYNPIVFAIRQMEKPVVAAVNGVAAGAGANLALACDIVVAKESTSFIQAFSKIGLIPDCGGTFFLPRLIGMQRAAALMMTADKVMAKEAEAMGMIYKAFADEDFEMEVEGLMQRLAQMPTKGLAYTKKLLNETFSRTMEEQLGQEAKIQAASAATEDFKEGVQAFIEKRKPTFKGQ